jgi:hypothetical protein
MRIYLTTSLLYKNVIEKIKIKSIGNLNAEENVVHAKRVTDFITGCLPVEPSRVLIHFENLQRHEVAKNGISIQAMLEGK